MAKTKKNPTPKAVTKYRTRTVEIAKKAGRRARKIAGEEVHTLSAVGASMLLGALESRKVALPEIPFLGVAGTWGAILWFIGRQMKNKTIQHLGTGLLSIQGYKLAYVYLGPGRISPAVADRSGKMEILNDPFGTSANSPAQLPRTSSDPFQAPAPALSGVDYLDNANAVKAQVLGAVNSVLDDLDGDDLDGDDLDGDDLDGDDLDGLDGDDLDGDDLDGLEDELDGDDLDGDDLDGDDLDGDDLDGLDDLE
jgi:hypothetical protein